MPKKVYNNVEDHKLLDGKKEVEDVTKVGLPAISHKTNTVSASGMVADVDVPNTSRLEAMEYTIVHNNGLNSEVLATPGKHTHEFRVARQVYNVDKASAGYEGVKYRLTGLHKKTDQGDIETGNPIGSTETYSCLRFEKIVGKKTVVLIDAMTGVVKYNGKSFTDLVKNLLK